MTSTPPALVPPPLRSCPFCGGKAEKHHGPWDQNNVQWWIRCEGCHARTTGYVGSSAYAVECWNRRDPSAIIPDPDQLAAANAEIERLKATLLESAEALEQASHHENRVYQLSRCAEAARKARECEG